MKFAVAEDERPILTVELPVAVGRPRTSSAWPSRGCCSSATSCSRSRRAGSGSAARSPRPPSGSAGASHCSPATRIDSRSSFRRERDSPEVPRRSASRFSRPSSSRSPPASPRRSCRRSRLHGPDLSLVTDARYDVQPELKRVAVTVDVTATNHRTDTPTRRYYYDAAFLTVQPGTINFSVSAASGKPTVRISKRTKDYTLLEIRFGTRVFSGRNLEFQVKFDLPDPGGSPTRDVRIGTTLVAFPVWAFSSEDTPGSAVERDIPTGLRGQIRSRGDGRADDDGERRPPLHGRLDRRRPRLLRVHRRRPAGRVRGTGRLDERQRQAGRDGRAGLDRRSRVGNEDGRPVPRRHARARRGDRARLPGGHAGRREGGRQSLARRLRRALRSRGAPDRGRLLRRRGGGPPRSGAHVVQRRAARRSLGERGVRVVLRRRRGPRAGHRGPAGPAHRRAAEGTDPAQRLGRRSGASRATSRTTRTPPRSSWPSRSRSGPDPTRSGRSGMRRR